MRNSPANHPCWSDAKASAEAMPEQKTNISAASLNPYRAGIQFVQGFHGTCATRMMHMPRPRKKSSRGSRGRRAAALSDTPDIGPRFDAARDDAEAGSFPRLRERRAQLRDIRDLGARASEGFGDLCITRPPHGDAAALELRLVLLQRDQLQALVLQDHDNDRQRLIPQ